MFNFMRFGEKGNSLVLDLTLQEKKDLKDGIITMDQIYDRVMKDPVKHIMEVKRRGVERLLAIAGIIDGNQEFSNGAGKSTLMEAMCYSRYERIVRRTAQNPDRVEKAGLSVVTKIDNKYPPNMKESWVEELCEIGDKIYRIRRGRAFSKNHKNHTPIMELECLYEGVADSKMSHRTGDTKANLDEIMTMDYDLFVNSQMFGQNDAGKYLIGTDKTKKEMLIALLRLENIVTGCLENIRKKKNAQEKKNDAVKAALEVIESDLRNKYYELMHKAIERLDSAAIQEIIVELKNVITINDNNAKTLEQKISSIEEKISELSKSEKLKKVESIREDGRRINGDKKTKEQAMLSQVSEWEKLLNECKASLTKKTQQITSTSDKIAKLEKAKQEKDQAVKAFDMPKCQEQLQRVEKAKKLKPQILKSLSDARDSLQKASNDSAILKNSIRQLELDLGKLKKHGASSGFVCPECHSEVTQEHVVSAMASIEDSINKQKEGLVTAQAMVETHSKSVSDYESKSNRINDMLVSEAGINASIKGFDDDKSKVLDLTNQIKESNESLEQARSDKSEVEKNITTYELKIVDIRKLFEDEINQLKAKIEELIKQLKLAESDAKTISDEIATLQKQKEGFASDRNKAMTQYGAALKDEINVLRQIQDYTAKAKDYEDGMRHLNRLLLLEDVYGLDGIQTRIVKKYLPLLNVYIKEFLDILSDGLMTVKMIINDKSKVDMIISGGTSETYEMLSGGEKTIVRLAVDIGLSLLAFSRTTQKPEMICLDEIFGSLDAGRTRNVFKVLSKLSDKFSRIILISHNADINNQIKSRIIIEKSGGRMGLSEIKRIE